RPWDRSCRLLRLLAQLPRRLLECAPAVQGYRIAVDAHVDRQAADFGADGRVAVLDAQSARFAQHDAGTVHRRILRLNGSGRIGAPRRARFDAKRGAHEVAPDARGQAAAGYTGERRVVVVAHPYAD